jgi:hypothetical protein
MLPMPPNMGSKLALKAHTRPRISRFRYDAFGLLNLTIDADLTISYSEIFLVVCLSESNLFALIFDGELETASVQLDVKIKVSILPLFLRHRVFVARQNIQLGLVDPIVHCTERLDAYNKLLARYISIS